MRAKNATQQADAYNTQQSHAVQEGDKQSASAAEASNDLKNSINQDKQNMARRNDGGVSISRQAKIDYTGGSARPI